MEKDSGSSEVEILTFCGWTCCVDADDGSVDEDCDHPFFSSSYLYLKPFDVDVHGGGFYPVENWSVLVGYSVNQQC